MLTRDADQNVSLQRWNEGICWLKPQEVVASEIFMIGPKQLWVGALSQVFGNFLPSPLAAGSSLLCIVWIQCRTCLNAAWISRNMSELQKEVVLIKMWEEVWIGAWRWTIWERQDWEKPPYSDCTMEWKVHRSKRRLQRCDLPLHADHNLLQDVKASMRLRGLS